MIDKKILLERLEKKIEFYEKEKESVCHKSIIESIDFSIVEIKRIIDEIKWGIFDVK